MNRFTFLSPRPAHTGRNETVIYFFHEGQFNNFYHNRNVAWHENLHLVHNRFSVQIYRGTMFRFFADKLYIPQIRSIETPHHYFSYVDVRFEGYPCHTFGSNEQVEIYWYEFI